MFIRNVSFEAMKGGINYEMIDDRSFWLKTDPDVDVKSNYKACSLNVAKDNSYPIISKDFFSFCIDELLVRPDDNAALMNAAIEFQEFPENYNFISNYSIGNQKEEIKDTSYVISRSVLSGGKLDVETFKINNNRILDKIAFMVLLCYTFFVSPESVPHICNYI